MIVTVELTSEQERLLAPIVTKANATHNNVLFIATCAPHNGSWRLQAMVVTARVGSKVLALLKKKAAAATNSNVSRESRGGPDQ